MRPEETQRLSAEDRRRAERKSPENCVAAMQRQCQPRLSCEIVRDYAAFRRAGGWATPTAAETAPASRSSWSCSDRGDFSRCQRKHGHAAEVCTESCPRTGNPSLGRRPANADALSGVGTNRSRVYSSAPKLLRTSLAREPQQVARSAGVATCASQTVRRFPTAVRRRPAWRLLMVKGPCIPGCGRRLYEQHIGRPATISSARPSGFTSQ